MIKHTINTKSAKTLNLKALKEHKKFCSSTFFLNWNSPQIKQVINILMLILFRETE